ncbi:MAG: hypothetical protein HFJ19_02305 [Clostridia bacterium]|nr:hypothetical protein [Clostridia bacterium]
MTGTILSITIPIIIGLFVLLALVLLAKSMYRIADVDKALIITGGKKPKIIISGGAFVIPIIRKADFFDLCMLTVPADEDEIMTKTAVPIIVDWTAQIRPDRHNEEKLETAIISFKERGKAGIIEDVRLTLMGAVRDVVASMTPEEVLADKEAFKRNVQESVDDEMNKMGLELVSLNIQDITDSNDYFANIAFLDKSEKQKAADIKAAETDRITRERQANERLVAERAEAEANRDSEVARMDAEQAEKEKRKETDMKIAQFRIETDTAQANAEVAKELQATIRQKEVEEQRGAVEIMKQEQMNLAAQKERAVMVTRAESEKATKRINAEAIAEVNSIEADNEIQVAERKANAKRKEAEGSADVQKTQAEARVAVAEKDAKAVKLQAEATAAKTRAEGSAAADVAKAQQVAEAEGRKAQLLAEAEGTKAQQLAEAEGIKAKKLAEAEGERALAEARAACNNVNFEIEKLKIQTDAQIKIATSTAEIMANIGQNAEFVNIGGGNLAGLNGTGGGGNALLDTIMSIPGIMKVLNVENQALNGQSMADEIKELSDATFSGLGALKNTTEDAFQG